MVARYTLIVWLTLAVALSLGFPFSAPAAADADGGESSSLLSDDRDTQLNVTDAGTLTAETVAASTDAADAVSETAVTTTETGTSTGTEATNASETGDGTEDSTRANGSDSPNETRAVAGRVGDLVRLSSETDAVAVEVASDSDEGASVSVAVETDPDLLDPSAIEYLERLLEAVASESGVELTLEPTESIDEPDREVGADAVRGPGAIATNASGGDATASTDDDDGAPAGPARPDDGVPYEYVPPLAAGLFVLGKPLSGLLSGAAVLLSDWATRLAAAFRYSRREGSDPLEHETRSDIHDLVDRHPGISLTDLADRLETPLSTVRHHVRTLERERHLTTQKRYGHRRLYPVGAENEALAAAMDNESTATIIESIHERGQATVGEIVDDVGTTYSTVSHHLSRLSEAGVVTKEKEGRCTVSRLAPSAQSALHAGSESPAARTARRPSNAD